MREAIEYSRSLSGLSRANFSCICLNSINLLGGFAPPATPSPSQHEGHPAKESTGDRSGGEGGGKGPPFLVTGRVFVHVVRLAGPISIWLDCRPSNSSIDGATERPSHRRAPPAKPTTNQPSNQETKTSKQTNQTSKQANKQTNRTTNTKPPSTKLVRRNARSD